MDRELNNRCPICLDIWENASYVMPCLHQFCYACIMRWMDRKPECPLCKKKVTSIVHSVQADDVFQEHVIISPAESSVISHQAGGSTGHPAAHNLHIPEASLLAALELVPRSPPVGNIYPQVWASLFQEDPVLLWPVLPWLQPAMRQIMRSHHWEATAAAQVTILHTLRNYGPDEEILVSQLLPTFGENTRSFVHQLIETIVDQCGEAARRRMGLGNAHVIEEVEGSPEAVPSLTASQRHCPAHSPVPSSSPDRSDTEDIPSTSSTALHGGPSSHPSAPVPVHGEQEELQEDAEEGTSRSSTPSWGSQHSSGEVLARPEDKCWQP